MYRLMIVDDESHARQQLKTAVNWEFMNIRIVGEAQNGIDALSLAYEKKPDLVICDIRMPRMDGISFASEYLNRYPDTQFIFLSGYSDKMYLKNAIRLEAVDYIFKPFELPDLLSAVSKALERMKKKQQHDRNAAENDFAFELLYHASDPSVLKEWLEEHPLPLDFSQPWYALVLRLNTDISFSKYQTGIVSDPLEGQTVFSRFFPSYDQAISALCDGKYILSKGGNSLVAFFNLNDFSEETSDLTASFSGLLNITSEVSTSLGISQCFHRYQDIRTAFSQAREAALSVFLTEYGKVYRYEFLSTRCFSPNHETRIAFLKSLEDNHFSESSNYLEDYFLYLKSCSCHDIPAIREDLLQLALVVKAHLKNSPFKLLGEFISSAATLDDILLYLQYLLECCLQESDQLDHFGRTVFEAESYVLKHLDSPLSIRQIADYVYVSPTYLCFLYKKQTGKTLNQFILDSRMKKAKRLLLDTNMKIGDIAASLGYANQNYFTKTFSSYYGATPTNFRNRGY